MLFGEPGVLSKPPIRALVRYVSMHQCGHFMMGRVIVREASLGVRTVSLSGAYGGDGLLCDCDESLWGLLAPVPQDLQDQFWGGGGHNSAGNEGPAMRDWALANIRDLRKLYLRK